MHLCTVCIALGCALVAPAVAHAAGGGVTVEAGAGESKPTPTIQPSAFEYQKLQGRWQPTEALYLSASVRATHDFLASATPGTPLRTGPDWVWFGTLDMTYDVSQHVTFGVGLNGSLPSTRFIASPLTYPFDRTTSRDSYALMRTESSSIGGSFDVTYDTTDDDSPAGPLEGSVDVSVGYTNFATDQVMTMLDAPSGTTTIDAFAGACRRATSPLCDVAARANAHNRASLNQARLGATLTATVEEHTDAAVDVAYYGYDHGGPENTGFFHVTPANGGGQTATYGAGLPVIPTQFSVRPELGHKWEKISVRAWYQFSDYTEPGFVGHTVGGKVQLYLGDWRVYGTGSFRADVSLVDTADTWSVGIGLTRLF
jgi:hypothetical protein